MSSTHTQVSVTAWDTLILWEFTRTRRFRKHLCHSAVQVSFSVLGAAFFALLRSVYLLV